MTEDVQQAIDAAVAEYRSATDAQASASAEWLQVSKRYQARRAQALVTLRRYGLPYRDIAEATGISTTRVHQIIDLYQSTDSEVDQR